MPSADFKSQANALLRKSATYQKRNVGTNICLLSAPIFFCILLLVIRLVINNVFLSGEQFKCGCYCNKCCKDGVCAPAAVCDYDLDYVCEDYDRDRCGTLYSTPEQAVWCEVANPSTWPALITLPRTSFRAQPYRPGAACLTTATGAADVAMLASGMLPLPQLTAASFLAGLSKVFRPDGSVDAAQLSVMGFNLATTTEARDTIFIEPAFSGGATVLFLFPATSTMNCSRFGLPDRDPLPFLNFTSLYINITTAETLPLDAIYTQLGGLSIQGELTLPTLCTDMFVPDQGSVADINRALFCGYTQAACNGTPTTAEYPTALSYNTSGRLLANLTMWYNRTQDDDNGGGPNAYYRLPGVFNMAVRGWWRSVSSALGPVVQQAVEVRGVMSMPKRESELKLDFSTFLGPLFYTWVVQLLLPTFLQQLVYEKEKRLRMMMKMHGLGDRAYWLITYLWYYVLYSVYIAIFIIFGGAIGLEVFRRTAVGIQVIFYFLFGNCMIAFSFMLSSLFTSSRTSTVVAFLYVFASGLIGELLLKVFMEQGAQWIFFLEWVPAWALYRGLWEMSEYSFLGTYNDSPGLTFASLRDKNNGMAATWGIFAVEWVVFMVAGWYLEQVLSSGTGIRRHPLFFLGSCLNKKNKDAASHPSNAVGPGSFEAKGSQQQPGGAAASVLTTTNGSGSLNDAKVSVRPVGELEDVQAERMRVEDMTSYDGTPIVVKDLRKVYPALDGGKPKVAVRTLSLAIERGECFGLLGPNGAGKSTSINMLTGFLEPSSGTAVVEGNDIRTEMSNIYKLMGVCPQHDLLWEQLSGEEHLMFYGRLKGLKGAELNAAVEAALRSVNLWNGGVARKLSAKYSGGMKRRLSVAISFMGDPRVVYLDEPSTGLDPASRRNLWEVVKSSKQGRAIILTTHSMEEAETLCDRLGIFVDGQLVCIGNPREITSRYAGYLVFTITVAPGDEAAARAFVERTCSGARLTYALGGTLKYELPTSDISLAGVFSAMEGAKQCLAVLDWGVANATLEEVFIKFARSIGAETKED